MESDWRGALCIVSVNISDIISGRVPVEIPGEFQIIRGIIPGMVHGIYNGVVTYR